jgi:hypothetical protein
MLEIPALAPTVAALCVLAFGNRSRWPVAEMAAGVLFGIAVEIKLISLVLLPMAALLVWLNQRHDLSPVRSVIKRLLVLSVCMAAAAIAADLVASHGAYLSHFGQAWTSHFGGVKSLEYGSPNEHRFDWAALLKSWDLTLPATVGVVVCCLRLRSALPALAPLAWLASNLLVFGLHRPWWNYYFVHTAVPLCWCAAIGIDAVWARAHWPQSRLWCVGLALYGLCVGGWIIERIHLQIQSTRISPQTYTCLFLKEMERYKSQAKWLYAEEPAYSFQSGIPLPPDLAVLMLKRYWSGEMTSARLAEELRTFKPELMLLRNDTQPRPFRDLLNAEYQLTYMDTDNLLYVHKSIVNSPKD